MRKVADAASRKNQKKSYQFFVQKEACASAHKVTGLLI
jgi:hypothetical protein